VSVRCLQSLLLPDYKPIVPVHAVVVWSLISNSCMGTYWASSDVRHAGRGERLCDCLSDAEDSGRPPTQSAAVGTCLVA